MKSLKSLFMNLGFKDILEVLRKGRLEGEGKRGNLKVKVLFWSK